MSRLIIQFQSKLTYSATRLGIFVGFSSFFVMEKTLRVLGAGADDSPGHSHSHSHSIAESVVEVSAQASGIASPASVDGLRSRGSEKSSTPASSQEEQSKSTSANSPSKLSAYLNLFGDFVHNM
jgi:zinc transporter 7